MYASVINTASSVALLNYIRDILGPNLVCVFVARKFTEQRYNALN